MARSKRRVVRKGRAGRTAFVLGLLLTIAAVSAVAAISTLGSMTTGSEGSELEQYIDGLDAVPTDIGGWTVEFPNEPTRGREGLSFPVYAVGDIDVTATRWRSEAEGQTVVDALVFDVDPAVAQNPTLLEGVLASLATSLKAERSDIDTPGDPTLPYRDAKLVYETRPKGEPVGTTTFVRVLHSDRTVIVLRITTTFPSGRPALFGRFVSSLERSSDAEAP